MKTLSIFIRDNGDGSQSLVYCLDYELAYKFEELLENEDGRFPDWIIESFQSGDGIQMKRLKIPDECTYDSLGIHETLTVEYTIKEYSIND